MSIRARKQTAVLYIIITIITIYGYTLRIACSVCPFRRVLVYGGVKTFLDVMLRVRPAWAGTQSKGTAIKNSRELI